jgi:glucose/arabinose dehydrogenase
MKKKLLSKFSFIVMAMSLLSFSACDKDDDDKPTDNPSTSKSLHLKEMSGNFVSPIALLSPPDETNRVFVIDQAGKVFIINSDGNMAAEPFFDATSKLVSLNPQYDERGLLGFAFHPNYKTNGKFYVYYSAPLKAGAPANWNHTSIISEFTASSDPNKANMASERVILEVNKPQPNHNGGTVAFGKDGFLYISLGDGGGANDVGIGHVNDWYTVNDGGNAQDVNIMLGKILRIDVNSGSPYTVPGDNPLVNKPGLDEIYALGFRNPYRFSFDRATGDLYVGDAGQNLYEEVDRVTLGGNYGWNVREGAHCFSTTNPNQSLGSCPSSDPDGRALIDPVIEFQNINNFTNGLGLVVVGGYIYRGNAIPSLQGKYLFSNFTTNLTAPSGDVYVATPGGGRWPYEKMNFTNIQGPGIGYFVKGFGEDGQGELYVLASKQAGPTGNTGKVLKIVEE